MLLIKRISRILALIVAYIICGYGYLTAKGFVFDNNNNMILSNPAYAEEHPFSRAVKGDLSLGTSTMRAIGNADAPLTMYALSSMTCAHCRDFHKETFPKLQKDFIDTGKLRFIFVHFPLEPVSMRAAKLSYCLPEELFYPFIDELYSKKDWLFAEDENILYAHAKKFGMTEQDIFNCNADKRLTSDILRIRENASKDFEITGTPSFIIEGKDGQELIAGSKHYSELKAYLEKRITEVD